MLVPLSLVVGYDHKKHDHEHHEHHEHDAHVHGIGKMNLILENQQIQIEMSFPSINVVGFEHQPSTPEQKELVKQSLSNFKNPANVFVFPPEAQCEVSAATADMVFENEEQQKQETEEVHSEFVIQYSFQCQAVENMHEIDSNIFQWIRDAEKINIDLVVNGHQLSQTLTADHASIHLEEHCHFSLFGVCFF